MKKITFLFSILFTLSISITFSQPQWIVYNTQNSGLPTNSIGSITIDFNNLIWIGTADGLAKYNWSQWIIYDTNNTPLQGNSIQPLAFDNTNIWFWVGDYYNRYGAAKFDGLVWTIYNTTNSGLPTNWVNCIEVDNLNRKWIGTTGGLAKYNDTMWNIYSSTNSGLPYNNVKTVCIEGNIKWMGHEALVSYAGLTKYNDTTWTIYTHSNSGLPDNSITIIKLDLQKNKWIGMYFGGLAKFNSNNNSWTVYNMNNSGLPDNHVLSLIIDKDNIKWIGTLGGGLARFNDTNWVIFNPNNSPLPSSTVWYLSTDSNNNKWISTPSGLAVYNSTGVIGIQNQNKNIATLFKLYQNYPNPFNPITNIEFALPKTSYAKLIVYDLLGKEVVRLVNEELKAGSYKVSFNGDKLSSGVYYYNLIAGDFIETKKMVLVK